MDEQLIQEVAKADVEAEQITSMQRRWEQAEAAEAKLAVTVEADVRRFTVPRLDQGGELKHNLNLLNYAFTVIFIFEMLVKIVAYGFAMHPESYLRDAWCQLDFVVVSLAWIPILFPGFGNFSVIRSVRALRPP